MSLLHVILCFGVLVTTSFLVPSGHVINSFLSTVFMMFNIFEPRESKEGMRLPSLNWHILRDNSWTCLEHAFDK